MSWAHVSGCTSPVGVNRQIYTYNILLQWRNAYAFTHYATHYILHFYSWHFIHCRRWYRNTLCLVTFGSKQYYRVDKCLECATLIHKPNPMKVKVFICEARTRNFFLRYDSRGNGKIKLFTFCKLYMYFNIKCRCFKGS